MSRLRDSSYHVWHARAEGLLIWWRGWGVIICKNPLGCFFSISTSPSFHSTDSVCLTSKTTPQNKWQWLMQTKHTATIPSLLLFTVCTDSHGTPLSNSGHLWFLLCQIAPLGGKIYVLQVEVVLLSVPTLLRMKTGNNTQKKDIPLRSK